MRFRNFVILLFFSAFTISELPAQPPAPSHYGAPHPEAPAQLADYQELIGRCHCKSIRRNQDGNWPDTVNAVWQFKYVLGGWAVQDETWKDDGTYTSSLRQYNSDSAEWVVTYFSSSSPTPPPHWTGGRKGDKMVLYRPQKSPNGLDGFNRLTFYDISEQGFKWIGEWVSQDESFSFPFWKIFCEKIKTPETNLSWLQGQWKNDKNGAIEEWTAAGENVFKGQAYKPATNHKKQILEELMLYKSGENWYYTPDVAHNAYPVPFKLMESTPEKLVFVNKTHDYPKQIVYERKGEGKLLVWIADLNEEGKAVNKRDFNFSKIQK